MLNKLQPPTVTGGTAYLPVSVTSSDSVGAIASVSTNGIQFETHNARPEAFDYVCLVLLLLTAACFGAVLGFVYGKKHSTAN